MPYALSDYFAKVGACCVNRGYNFARCRVRVSYYIFGVAPVAADPSCHNGLKLLARQPRCLALHRVLSSFGTQFLQTTVSKDGKEPQTDLLGLSSCVQHPCRLVGGDAPEAGRQGPCGQSVLSAEGWPQLRRSSHLDANAFKEGAAAMGKAESRSKRRGSVAHAVRGVRANKQGLSPAKSPTYLSPNPCAKKSE